MKSALAAMCLAIVLALSIPTSAMAGGFHGGGYHGGGRTVGVKATVNAKVKVKLLGLGIRLGIGL